MSQIRRTTNDPITTSPHDITPVDSAFETDDDLVIRDTRESMEDPEESIASREDYDSRIGGRDIPVRPASIREQTLNPANPPDWNVNTATNDPRIVAPQDDILAEAPLFSNSEISDLRGQWSNVQADFVDEPRRAVQEADQLVGNVIQKLADGFATERSTLERQWDSGSTVSTEELRIALQHYRSFLGRLINAA